MTADMFMSDVAIILYTYTFLRAVKSKSLSCLSMSDITLLSKFLFSVEPQLSLSPNANLIIVHFFQARPSMFINIYLVTNHCGVDSYTPVRVFDPHTHWTVDYK